MILCDACDHGNHRGCIDKLGKYAPGKSDHWLCASCRFAGSRIELWDRASRQYLPAVIERTYKTGLAADIIYDDGNMEQVTLDHARWHALSPSANETIQQLCNVMLDAPTPRSYQHALTLDASSAVNDHRDTLWKASMRKEWDSIQSAFLHRPSMGLLAISPSQVVVRSSSTSA